MGGEEGPPTRFVGILCVLTFKPTGLSASAALVYFSETALGLPPASVPSLRCVHKWCFPVYAETVRLYPASVGHP